MRYIIVKPVSHRANFPGAANIRAVAGAVINYKRWSVINSNCNWIAFMPSLWNIRPVPVADSLWWGVLVTWIISPWAPQRTSGLSLHTCVRVYVCVSLCVCGICVRGRGLARVSGVATNQPRKSYPERKRARWGNVFTANWFRMDPISPTRMYKLQNLLFLPAHLLWTTAEEHSPSRVFLIYPIWVNWIDSNMSANKFRRSSK